MLFITSILSCCFLIFILNWCAVWKFQSMHLVQLFLSNPCAILFKIPYSFVLMFCFCFIWVFVAILIGSYGLCLSHFDFRIQLCFVKSCVSKNYHQILVVLFLIDLVSWFIFLSLVYILNCLILWCILIFRFEFMLEC